MREGVTKWGITMSYIKKSHKHMPKKGKGSYNRTDELINDPREIEEAWYEDTLAEEELADRLEEAYDDEE